MSKSIHTLTDEQLLASLTEDTNSTKTPLKIDYRNDVLNFILNYNIETGKERVKSALLYQLYYNWSKESVTQKKFTDELKLLFPFKIISHGYYFLINKKAIGLREETWNLLKPLNKFKQKGWHEHFKRYLENYSIKKGSFFVKDSVLFKLYIKWAKKSHKHHPLGSSQFKDFCKRYFETKSINGHKWFGIDYSITEHFNEEMIKEMKVKHDKKEKNKKIPTNIPSSKT